MSKKGITVQMVVKNEDRFIWYAISSVINYVSQIIIYDTGSTDNTLRIIRSFKTKKILLEEKGEVNNVQLANLRQDQIEKTVTDWFWVVDGDEVYPGSTVKEVLKYTDNSHNFRGGVIRRYDLLGDIYHYQSEDVGTYNLFGRKGHLVLRLINKDRFTSMNVKGTYPNEGYYDGQGKPLIDYPKQDFFITKNRIFHAMYLKRSSSGEKLQNTLHRNKYKIEKGNTFSKSIQLPEVLFQKKPSFVQNVTQTRDFKYNILASILTPIKIAKRKFWKLFT